MQNNPERHHRQGKAAAARHRHRPTYDQPQDTLYQKWLREGILPPEPPKVTQPEAEAPPLQAESLCQFQEKFCIPS